VAKISTMLVPNSERFSHAMCGRREPLDRLRSALGATAVFAVMAMVGWAVPARAAVPPVEVNTCGQVFSGNGFLSGDLDCSGLSAGAVTIQGGTLDLRGFTLTSTAPFSAVACEKSCRVVSDPPGGTITSDGLGTILAVRAFVPGGSPRSHLRISDVLINDGILSTSNGNIKVIDSTITGVVSNNFAGVEAFLGTARLLRSVITGNAGTGVNSAKARIIDSEVSNNGELGVFGSRSVNIKRSTVLGNGFDGVSTNDKLVRVTDSIITSNGIAGIDLPLFAKANIKRSDVSGNVAQGIRGRAKRVIVRDSTINNNGAEGILSDSLRGVVKLTDSAVTGNALDGIAQTDTQTTECRLTVKGSTVTGNGTDASCGVSRTCADLTSCGLPEVSASTCGTSYDVASGFPGTSWGVCSLD